MPDNIAGNAACRSLKGASLLSFPAEYVAIDIESTGLDARYDSIIELGAVRVSGGAELARFQSLVRLGYPLPEFITELTGITDEMLDAAPDIEEVLPQFLDFVGGAVLVGHNVNFDINFIYDTAVRCGLPPLGNDFVDTMRLSRRLHRELPDHRLQTVGRALGIPQGVEHRALADCLTASGCLEAMREYGEGEGSSLLLPPPSYNAMAKTITATTDKIREDTPVYGKTFVFTGALELAVRRDAMQATVNAGGLCGDGVTRTTDYLVLGNNDYCKTIKGGKSAKQKKAEALKAEGYGIEIISESVFYDMLAECGEPETEQIDLFEPPTTTASREAEFYAILDPMFRAIIKANNAPADAATFEAHQGYYTYSYRGSVVFRVHFAKSSGWVEYPLRCTGIADANQISWTASGNSGNASLFARTAIASPEDAHVLRRLLYDLLDRAIDNSATSFSCCSLYEACSDARRCINPDPKVSMDCYYRKNLKIGRIFYGKNPTE